MMKTTIFKKNKLTKNDKEYLNNLSVHHNLIINKKVLFVALYKNYSPTFIINKLGSYFYDPHMSVGLNYSFIKGIKASDLIALFGLEKLLSSSFLDLSLDIERRFKASIIDTILDYTQEYNVAFDFSNRFFCALQNQELQTLKQEIYHKNETEIQEQDLLIPVRLLIFNMSFGATIDLFNHLNDHLKQLIVAKWPQFNNQISNLAAMIRMVKELRNCLAHGELLINFTTEMPLEIQKQLQFDLSERQHLAHLYPVIYGMDYYFCYHNSDQQGISLLNDIFNLFSFSSPAQTCLRHYLDLPSKVK